jgi:hypothetical protein
MAHENDFLAKEFEFLNTFEIALETSVLLLKLGLSTDLGYRPSK